MSTSWTPLDSMPWLRPWQRGRGGREERGMEERGRRGGSLDRGGDEAGRTEGLEETGRREG